ncbi:hypothetical protein FISHEDRAFT_26204, partial [Fistulina hepatica ATCC 64428]
AELKDAVKAAEEEHGQAKRTKAAYDGYIARGRKFLADLVASRRREHVTDGMDTNLLERAFDDTPNRLSSDALTMFITDNCLTPSGKQLQHSTAESCQAAFVKLWESVFDGHYSGPYYYDNIVDKVTGCPAKSQAVKSVVKLIKNRNNSKGAWATRAHAEAMHLEDLEAIMAWSLVQCPIGMVNIFIAGKIRFDHSQAKLVMEHTMMRAFLSTDMTLWTRNSELCDLRTQNVKWDCVSTNPYQQSFHRIFLECRKGWQNKQGFVSDENFNMYNIYPQQDIPALDAYGHLNIWRSVLSARTGSPMSGADCVFPFFQNSAPHCQRPMTHEVAQSLINRFATGAGLNKEFTTHSLRRGGAQYRFIHAPLGQRWSLTMIQWWGGWAAGEQV